MLTESMINQLRRLLAQEQAASERPAKDASGNLIDSFGYSPELSVGGSYAPKHTCEALVRRQLVDVVDCSGLRCVRINSSGRKAYKESLQ